MLRARDEVAKLQEEAAARIRSMRSAMLRQRDEMLMQAAANDPYWYQNADILSEWTAGLDSTVD